MNTSFEEVTFLLTNARNSGIQFIKHWQDTHALAWDSASVTCGYHIYSYIIYGFARGKPKQDILGIRIRPHGT